jgi:hypothetical protein
MMIYKYSQLHGKMNYEETKRNLECKSKGQKFHLGQLKLLISEILFLTKTYGKGKKVLYAGAAAGYHIYKLAELFPELTFDLWDPAKFDIPDHARITIYNKPFTNDVARGYTNQGGNILFISDIRSFDIGRNRKDLIKIDRIVEDDNEKQKEWVRIINPVYAFLKFRPGYNPGKTEYLGGTIYLQAYSPLSAETRLYTNNYRDLVTYDNEEFDEKMAYFNCKIRPNAKTVRWGDIMNKYLISDVWDNDYALHVLSYYLDKVRGSQSNDATAQLFQQIIDFFNIRYKDKYNVVYGQIY